MKGTLNPHQRRYLGNALDDLTNAGSELAALAASNPPLWCRLAALFALVLIARCERRLAPVFNAPDEPDAISAASASACAGQPSGKVA